MNSAETVYKSHCNKQRSSWN